MQPRTVTSPCKCRVDDVSSDNRFMSNDNTLTAQAEAKDENGNELWWCAHVHIAEFSLPLIRSMREKTHCYPQEVTYEEWLAILDKIIFSLEGVAKDNVFYGEESDKLKEGLSLFGEHFLSLWD